MTWTECQERARQRDGSTWDVKRCSWHNKSSIKVTLWGLKESTDQGINRSPQTGGSPFYLFISSLVRNVLTAKQPPWTDLFAFLLLLFVFGFSNLFWTSCFLSLIIMCYRKKCRPHIECFFVSFYQTWENKGVTSLTTAGSKTRRLWALKVWDQTTSQQPKCVMWEQWAGVKIWLTLTVTYKVPECPRGAVVSTNSLRGYKL